jgi:hypothetical protein
VAAHIEVSGGLRIPTPPAEAFSFFTPEGERLWVPGWEPEYLHPSDGALVEGLTFRTHHGGELTLWLVLRCDPAVGTIDYVRVTPDSRIGTVTVRLVPDGASGTLATVAYELTSLSPEGDRKLHAFAPGFPDMVGQWERSISALVSTRRAVNRP